MKIKKVMEQSDLKYFYFISQWNILGGSWWKGKHN